nr:MAG TPA: hypothetical protein [Caudoviricetes sp.]DAP89693.1 MAG TPA: hypothetical protein [Caudoviricetes sp.]
MGLIPTNFTVLSDYVFAYLHLLHCSYRNCLFKNLPYRYFNEFLVLYTDFSASRQISLLRISS